MKLRIALLNAILAVGAYAHGQGGFIVHYDALQAGRSGTGCSVREVDDGYLLFSRQYSQQFPTRQHVYTRRLDATGQGFSEKEYLVGDDRDFDIGYIDPVAAGPDGSFSALIAEGWYYPSESWLYTFDQTGDTIGHHFVMTFPPTDSVTHAIRQTRRTSDGGHVLGGFWNRPGDTQAYLVRLNTVGDTLWTRKYGPQSQNDVILGLAEYVDGGFVLTGYRQYGQPWDVSFLIRTDANGNQIWRRDFGNLGYDNEAVRVTPDGGIVTWSSYRESGFADLYYQVMLTKWDADGQVIWQKKSHYGYYSGTFDLEVLDDGSFIATGFGAENERGGMLIKFSSNGDSLWTRGHNVAHGPHYLYDVTPTADGGFVCTGQANRMMPIDAPNFHQSQTIYVVKTDSLGCVVPGCHTVGVQEYLLDLNDHLQVSPNPVAPGQPVRITFDPPQGFTPKGPLRLLVLDALGKQVLEQRIGLSTPNLINLQPTTGLYYLHLTDGTRWLAGSKVVLE